MSFVCATCRDLGIIRLKHKESKDRTLAMCSCRMSELNSVIWWRLPKLNKKMQAAFDVTPAVAIKSPTEWLSSIQRARAYWESVGNMYEEVKPKHWSDR